MIELSDFSPRPLPRDVFLEGRFVTLESIDWDKHGQALANHIAGPGTETLWDYLPIGPFENEIALRDIMRDKASRQNWHMLSVHSHEQQEIAGTASYMRQRPDHGSVEVGCIIFGKALQRSRAATEAIYLMGQHIFEDLGYRRFEWKCDNKNVASKRAAERFGFIFEGVFRQDLVVKGRNRDTAWFSILDKEWPHIKTGFEIWLAENNFKPNGQQIRRLAECREALA